MANTVYYRFLVFSYESYYPNGGTGDLKISFNTIEELKEGYEYLPFGLYEYIDVFDTKTGRTVNKSDYFPEVVEEVKRYLELENKGRKLPKEDVYLKDPVEDNEDSALSELVVLLSELVYDDLTKEEIDDKKLKVFEKAMDAKKELEDREEK